MKATIEISMYPLHQEYEQKVLKFLDKLNSYQGVEVETNGLSTQLFGDYDKLMDLLKTEMKEVFSEQKAVFALKIGEGILRFNQ